MFRSEAIRLASQPEQSHEHHHPSDFAAASTHDRGHGWKWTNYEPATAKKTLDDFISRRGDVVHRSRPVSAGTPSPHMVKRDDLDKAIRFLKGLVEATDRALESE